MWSDIFSIRDEAWAVEKRIKKWSRAKKEALARNDLASLRQLARKKKRAARRV
jgi:predicted GIY-YIG superfamily endonuclease